MNKLGIGIMTIIILLAVGVAGFHISNISPPTTIITTTNETKQLIEKEPDEGVMTTTTIATEIGPPIEKETEENPIIFANISVTEAEKLIETENGLILLDVRTDYAYSREYIEGAINIPLQKIRDGVEMPEENNTILTYSQTSVAGYKAGKILIKNGYTRVYNLDGGINAWISGGLPTIQPHSTVTSDNDDCG